MATSLSPAQAHAPRAARSARAHPTCPWPAAAARQASHARPPSQPRGQQRRACCARAAAQRGGGYSGSSSSSSNLGVLQRVIEAPMPLDDPYAAQRVSVDSFRERGFYLDGAAIASSALLLVLLLALTFQRILGLDRLINAAIERWRERKQRADVVRAREALERSWDGGSDDSSAPPPPPPPAS